jgi:hypothetical protein
MIRSEQDYRNLSKNETKIGIMLINKKIIISNKIKKIKIDYLNKNIIIPKSIIFAEFDYKLNFNKIKIPKNMLKLSYHIKSNIIYKININNFIFLNIQNNRIKDISALGNIHTLFLMRCKNIKDVSVLGNIHTLNLCFCENIKDVNALGNVHTLNLSCCKNITNASALENVHTLTLYGTNITDVNTLKGVNKLILSKKQNNIKGVDKLNNIKYL